MMLAAVVVSAMAVTACTPKAGGPPTLEDELAAGNLTAAEEILNERIANAKDDAEFTARVVDLFKGSGIEVKDHLIVGRKQVFSFAFNFMLNGKHR